MKEKFLITMLIAIAVIAEFYPNISAQDAAAKAQELIAQARAALGGDKLKSLQSLSAEGNYRRTMGGMEMSGELVIEMALPDKMLKAETMRPFGDLEINRLEAINGDNVWEDQQQSGGGGGMVLIRRGGGTGDPHRAQEMMKNSIRADFARLSLGMLLTTAPSFSVQYSYAGEAESPDGKADVLDVRGANNFNVRLFLDQKTHRPLMITYKGKKPQVIRRTSTGAPPPEHELDKQIKEGEAEAAKSPDVEFQVRFAEYKEVSGISLPHRIFKGIENETSEEIEFTKYKVKPTIKPEKFVKK